MLLRLINNNALKKVSWLGLENFDQTHLVLASSKLALQFFPLIQHIY